MEIYEVENPQTGEVIEIQSDKPPTSEQLKTIFDTSGQAQMVTQQVKNQKVQQANMDHAVQMSKGFKGFGGGQSGGTGAGGEFPLQEPLRPDIPTTGSQTLDDFLKTAQGVSGQAAAGSLQGLTLGAAEAYMRRGGETLGKPQNTPEKIARYGTEIPAGFVGLGGAAYKQAIKWLPAATRASLKVATGSAAVGALYTPETPTGELLQVGQRAFNSAVSAVVGAGLTEAGGMVVKGIPRVAKATKNMVNKSGIAKKALETMHSVKTAMSDKFGKFIDSTQALYPGAQVNLEPAFNRAGSQMPNSPGLKAVINRYDRLKEGVKVPETFKNLSLKESQVEIKNLVTEVTNRIDPTKIQPSDIPLLDFVDDITQAQMNALPKAGAEAFKQELQQYATMSQNYKTAVRVIRTGDIVRTSSWDNPKTKEAIKNFLPADLYKEIGDARTAHKLVSAAYKTGSRILWILGGLQVVKTVSNIFGGSDE